MNHKRQLQKLNFIFKLFAKSIIGLYQKTNIEENVKHLHWNDESE